MYTHKREEPIVCLHIGLLRRRRGTPQTELSSSWPPLSLHQGTLRRGHLTQQHPERRTMSFALSSGKGSFQRAPHSLPETLRPDSDAVPAPWPQPPTTHHLSLNTDTLTHFNILERGRNILSKSLFQQWASVPYLPIVQMKVWPEGKRQTAGVFFPPESENLHCSWGNHKVYSKINDTNKTAVHLWEG